MGKSKKEQTPLMKQYWGVKSAHPDKIVLFRMGDFFEMFHEDAQIAAPLLGIALTVRNKKSGDQTPMCGVPHHSIGGQINKLLQAGKKVAICDQVEDPKLAKGLVKREVTRILTPGMVFDSDTLESESPNYVCCFDSQTLSFMDSSTGECFFYEISDTGRQKMILETLNPVEVVFSESQENLFHELKPGTWAGVVSFHEELFASVEEEFKNLPVSSRRLLSYAISMQGSSLLSSLQVFEKRQSDFRLQVSNQVYRHLEVFKTYKGEKDGSLFKAIDRTKTPGGARRLKSWLQFPLTDQKRIEERQDQVAHWCDQPQKLKEIRQCLFKIGDLERRLGKLSQPQCHPRDLRSLGDSMEAALHLVPYMNELKGRQEEIQSLQESQQQLNVAFVEEIPNQFRDGSFIAKGFNQELDELIEVATDSQSKVRELEAREKEHTGISSLKVRYNNVFGYYIEVTNTHKNKVPTDRYQRKQTLTNAERYVTDELNDLEKKVITAKTRRADLELEILAQLKASLLTKLRSLLFLADQCNQLDVFSALAWLAIENSYCRPKMTETGAFQINGSRHPVIEQVLQQNFVANDIQMGPNQCLLITGPNMAGKSTLMRQVAITSIMAQVGSFVPAEKAQLPIVDKIFTRIGASDFLTEGLSTFMVEMTETAEMLKQATPQSLVILDEVGRGTSTYDGMSLAQSILEYFLRQLKSYTLFATHYHELTHLESRYSGLLVNCHMAISEKRGEILFRYQLSAGPAEKSYGIQVAKLAGLPPKVIQYANQLLNKFENGATSSDQLDLWKNSQVSMDDIPSEPEVDPELMTFVESVRKLEIQNLTPLDALNRLAQWQRELS